MKKLSLKRKLPQEKREIKKVTKCHTNGSSDHNVTVDSKSPNTVLEVVDNEVVHKQRHEEGCEKKCVSHSITQSTYLNTGDQSLNRLRLMILSLSSKESNLQEFPPISEDQLNDDQSTGFDKLQGRQPLSSKQCDVIELSPFPKVCRHFWARKRKHDAIIEKDTGDSFKSELGLTDNSQMNDEYDGNISTMTGQNSGATEKRTNNVSTYRENNSHLLRDRNSNLYTLQSHNTSIIHSNVNNSFVNPTNDTRKSVSSVSHHSNKVEKQCTSKHSTDVYNIEHENESKTVNGNSFASVQCETTGSMLSADDDPDDNLVTLKNCPLCQTQFSDRQSQIDIDSHIAACFAASEDSMTW